MTDNTANTITKTQIDEESRLDFLPAHTGRHYLDYEFFIYDIAALLVEGYNGGFWQFYNLSNGGFYMALDQDEPMHMTNQMNYFDGSLSPDAASIVLNLIAISDFSLRHNSTALGEKYHQLLDYARLHPEADMIFKAID